MITDMPRPRTAHVADAEAELLRRLDGGHYAPGDRFLSNRGAARLLGVSYQTADRLLRGLASSGRLLRRAGSGSFLPGARSPFLGATLVLHRRARRAGSFGARLHAALAAALKRAGIDVQTRFVDPLEPPRPLRRDRLPIVWEAAGVARALQREHRRMILVNERPIAGIASLLVDSIAVDDFTGGACAAELLLGGRALSRRLAILAGPVDDIRSNARIAGFRSVAPARALHAPNWYAEGGAGLAAAVVRAGRDGVFCCNDRLAQAVLAVAGAARPRVVGFDDAPVARALGLTTIAIPWDRLADAVAEAARRRIDGEVAPSSHLTLPTTPMIRDTCAAAPR